MTAYYCDIDADFVNRDGSDSGANVLTGPGGLQAAIRGTGLATALVAGDTLYVEGDIGRISRLVKIQTVANGHDADAWGIGDTVRNAVGAGNHWTGKVAQAVDDTATGLAALQVLVQLDSAYDYEDVYDNWADDIENTTVDPNETATINAQGDVTCVGVEIDTNAGNGTAGLIDIIGVNASWADDGTQAILDADGDATNCLLVSKNGYNFKNLTAKNAASDGFGHTGIITGAFFNNCQFINNTDEGIQAFTTWTNGIVYKCLFQANARGMYRPRDGWMFLFNSFFDQTSMGIQQYYSHDILIGNVFHENIKGYYLNTAGGYGLSLLLMNVFDGGTHGAQFVNTSATAVPSFVLSNRFTDISTVGLAMDTGIVFEDFNYFDTNTADTSGTAITGSGGNDAVDVDGAPNFGYVDRANHDFNVADGSSIDSEPIELPSTV